MALTTYVKGRAYDWSHAIGRASANGTGFNYPQTMCLGNDGDVYVANRGNENNFGMRVNHVKVGGPGEEELLAEFATYGEEDGKTHLALRRRGRQTRPRLRHRRMDEHGLGLRRQGQVHPQMGHARQRTRRVARAGRHRLRAATAT